jgi:1,4-dihydroxy-2-naphthoate octaprenyltransferase
MKNYKFLIDPMRLPFLVLTPASVILGLGTAIWTHGKINWFHFVLILIGALAAHISVNAFNEYFDFKSGLDAKTRRTPFSGGSGRLQKNPELEKPAYIMSWGFLALVGLIGIYFSLRIGFALIPLGLIGILLIFFYTEWITRYPFLCLIAPGLGFGTLMVMGTDFVLTGSYNWSAFVASLVPFFLVSNLLLLNQFPDVEVDREVGRKHYPIQIGKARSSWIYLTFLILPFIAIALGVVLDLFPLSGLLGLLGLLIVLPIIQGVLAHAENTEELIPVLGQNVLVNLATPILLAIGLMLGWPG